MRSNSITLIVIGAWLLASPLAVWAYIDAGGDRITLPELLLEFRDVAAVQIDKADLQRGAVLYRVQRSFQGKLADPIKHALLSMGEVPAPLRGLAVGQPAVLFTRCMIDRRGVTLTNFGWYQVNDPPNPQDGWHRLAMLREDLESAFLGTPEQLSEALSRLRDGQRVVVRIRPRDCTPSESVLVLCNLDDPHNRPLAWDSAGPTPEQRPMKQWLADLKSGTVPQRVRAALALAKLPATEESVTGLIAALRDRVAVVRAAACESLGVLKTDAKRVVPKLAKSLDDGDRFVCVSAARALAQYGAAAQPALPDLARSLGDRDFVRDFRPMRANAAAEAIVRIAPEDPLTQRALKHLEQRMLNDDRPDSYGTRVEGARILGRLGPVARPMLASLLRRLNDQDASVRLAAAHAVLRISRKQGDHELAVGALKKLVQHEDSLVRLRVARALADAPSRLAKELYLILQQDPAPSVRALALQAGGQPKAP
jgi:HEAT repeat protein